MDGMLQGFRWYGPDDPVPLSFIRQTGATQIVTSLHHIPYGETWSVKEIRERQKIVADAGLTWSVVESLPVHEEIKTRRGRCEEFIGNYKRSIENLAECGIHTITYNFMPVLDWIRTDLHYKLPDGSEALYFDKAQFAAFEVFILKRPGAEKDYSAATLAEAEAFFRAMTPEKVRRFTTGLIDNFPGFKGVTLEKIRSMLDEYRTLSRADLENNLIRFLSEVCPVAEKCASMLVIHPDDPPYPILGLPRIFSTLSDVKKLLKAVDSPANGVCFCAGSFSGRPDNDVVEIFKACAPRVGFIHLRSTHHDEKGNFYEANHLEGSVDMYRLAKAILEEQERRKKQGRSDWRIVFRPDHGHAMMDDLAKPPCPNPGYTAIGRMKGLAEIRGLEFGILKAMQEARCGEETRK
ncbi:MAG: mannonate dehydratase [Victivallaceae bacterium]|nr:mannonate dehydratase [Victivallaceae bacterium]